MKLALVFAFIAMSAALAASAAADQRFAVLPAVAMSTPTGRMDPNETIYFEFAFPIRHQADLENRIERVYDPKDPLYRQYLTPQEFGDDFGPSQQEYDAVAAYAERCGFTVTDRVDSRMMLGACAPASVVESGFGVHMMNYVANDGRKYRAPDRDLAVDPSVGSLLLGVIGLDDYEKPHSSSHIVPAPAIGKGVRIGAMGAPILSKGVRLRAGYTGLTNPYGGGLTPTALRTAYGVATSSWTGSGQTIATIDWGDQINLNDITAWENYYGIPTGNVTLKQYGAPMLAPMPYIEPNTGSFSTATSVTLAEWLTSASIYYTISTTGVTPSPGASGTIQYTGGSIAVSNNQVIEAVAVASGLSNSVVNVQVDGSNSNKIKTTANGGVNSSVEGTLDIECELAMAPNAKIITYQSNGYLPLPYILAQAANDSADPKVISTSYWDGYESDTSILYMMAENETFLQMAAQGQSMFSSSGDFGSNNFNIADPSSQPYLTSVGGTDPVTYPNGTMNKETTWTGSGGGVSAVWPMPGYQAIMVTKQSGGTTGRNFPDVAALASDPPGFSEYFSGIYVQNGSFTGFPYASGGTASQYGFINIGGTSVASPLWAGFTGLVNQERVARGASTVGFLNYFIYRIAHGRDFNNAFHNVADGVSNGAYTSIPGYNACTGLGSMNGSALLDDLTATGLTGGLVGYSIYTQASGTSVTALGIDDDLNMVGNNDTGGFTDTSSGVSNLPDGLGGTSDTVNAISKRSYGIGNYNITGQATDSSGNYHGYVYSQADPFMQDMGYLSNTYYTTGYGVNDAPLVAGVSGNDTSQYAVVYPSATDGLTSIAPIGGSVSSAKDINDFGEVVGTTSTASNASGDAFVWAPPGDPRISYMVPSQQYSNGMFDLGQVGGNSSSTATAINDWNEIAGYGVVSSGSEHALLWTNTWGVPTYSNNGATITPSGDSETYFDLDASDAGDSFAYAINDGTYYTDDASVVGALESTSGAVSAFIDTPSFPITDLNTLTDIGTGCKVTEANDINDYGYIAGQTTCGSTTNAVLLAPLSLLYVTVGAQSGSTVPITVALNGNAPSAGAIIGLVGSNDSAVEVPSSVTIASGQSSATTNAPVESVSAPTSLAVDASYGSATQVAHVFMGQSPPGLTATAGSQEIVLNWSPSTGATSYNVYVSTTSGGENIFNPTLFNQQSPSTVATLQNGTALANGTTYYLTVAAVSASGTSPMSAEVSATPFQIATPTLTATAGNATVTLNWTSSPGATSYDLYREIGTGGFSFLTSVTGVTYNNTGLTNGTTYSYEVYAASALESSNFSNIVSATPTASATDVVDISCGGSAASPYVADEDFAGGSVSSGTTHAITTTGVTNPAPQEVYQHSRVGNSTYTIGGLTAGAAYTVRLHFDEYYWTAAGKRTFNVSINGFQVLSNFDIFATSGGQYIANVQEFPTNANSSGQIVIAFTTVINNAQIDGIEIQTPGGNYNGTWSMWPQSATSLRLNVVGNGTANGTLLTVATTGLTNGQSFAFSNAGVVPSGDYNFSKVGGSYCVQPSGTTSGSSVEIWACAGSAAQSWAVSNATTSGYYILKPSSASTMCLNATGTTNGSSVTIATCNNGTGQAWGGL